MNIPGFDMPNLTPEMYWDWCNEHWKYPEGSPPMLQYLHHKLGEERRELAVELCADQPNADNIVSEAGDLTWVLTAMARNLGVPMPVVLHEFGGDLFSAQRISFEQIDKAATALVDESSPALYGHAMSLFINDLPTTYFVRESADGISADQPKFTGAYWRIKRTRIVQALASTFMVATAATLYVAERGSEEIARSNMSKIMGRIARGEAVAKPPRLIN